MASNGADQGQGDHFLVARGELFRALVVIMDIMEGDFIHKEGCNMKFECSCGFAGFKRYVGLKARTP